MGHRFLGALTRGPYRKFSGSRPPSRLRNRGLALPVLALLAALTLGLLFMLPGNPLHAQEAATELEYAENGTDPVATFTAVDPEGRTVYWDLVDAGTAADLNNDGDTNDPGEAVDDNPSADEAQFKISMDGVLNFKFPPNYEMPRGMAFTASNTRTYNVVVVSYDDAPGATSSPLPGVTDRTERKATYHKVTVTFTDVDEDGSVSLSGLQPQEDVELTATLKDDDASDTQITAAKWKWEQSSAMDGPWTLISGETDDVYMPASDVVGMYLQATATYTDEHGEDKTAMAVSAHMVRAVPAGQNAAPVFRDEDDTSADTEASRKVKENSPPGMAVGKPVTAGDEGDILTYGLDPVSGSETDVSSFSIDTATGQIKTKSSLNRENAGCGYNANDTPVTECTYTLTVRATDPYGDPTVAADDVVGGNTDTITVTITIENVNESPKMTVGPTRDSQEENEDTDAADAEGIQIPILSYAVTDADNDDADIKWSLMGADKDAFEIDKDGTTPPTEATSSAMVMFKETPNYEDPTDANMDNMYMVTVVATDAKDLTAMRAVVIEVTNANDDGKITFSLVQPKARIDFTVALTDEDGGVTDVKWQWARDDAGTSVSPSDCSTVTAYTDIDKAKSDAYNPKGGTEGDIGKCLRATATYTDANGSGKTKVASSANPVVDNLDNALPEFREGGDKPVTQAARYIVESAAADANVVVNPDGATESTPPSLDLVMATDPNGSADVLTYTLGGRDKDSFDIASDTGQITVKDGTELDYEKKNSYMVTVTATDPSLAPATIDVTINIVDVNEGPVIAGEDDITEEFRENLTSVIETFRATDPERRPVYWSLEQEDGSAYPDDGSLTIDSSGALRFKAKPDYETPGSDATDNAYTVVVVASDDAPDVGTPIVSSKRKFTVRVTNVIEQEQITVSPEYVEVDDSLTASLTPGDAITADLAAAVWRWSGAVAGTSTGETASITAPATKGTITFNVTYRALGKDRKKSKSITVGAAPGANDVPSFPDATSADVNENRPAGTVVGTFVARDANSEHRGRLVYTLPDNVNFSINNSGRLTTKVVLDHETNATLPLTITATDPSDGAGTLTITVTINDVDEAPTIATGPTRAEDWLEDKLISESVAVYTATDDPEGNDLVWSLTGTDASDFNIGNQAAGTPGTLTFKEMPDYEKPAASNNVYRVTVEVSDGKLKAMRPMTVTVTDVEEDGEVKLSTVAPRVTVELTAALKDSDDGVNDVTWQWARTSGTDAGTVSDPFDCSTIDDTTEFTNIEGGRDGHLHPRRGRFVPVPPGNREVHRPPGRGKDRHGRVGPRRESQQRQPRPHVQGE